MGRAARALALVALAAIPSPESDAEEGASAPRRAGARADVGINLAAANHWSSSQPFVDAISVADDWVSGSITEFRDGGEVDLDERGWIRRLAPGQVARMVILGEEARRPTGIYTFTYEGKGELRFDGAGEIVERSRGRMKVRVRDRGVLLLVVTKVEPEDPLRSMRLFYPGGRCLGEASRYCRRGADCGEARCVPFEETAEREPFHPVFLAEIAPFSVVRFLDWMDGNRELEDARPFPERIEDWPTVRDRRHRPVPLERIAELANEVEADPWLTLPPLASDDFLRAALGRVAQKLHPSRKVYVELGNELWNDIFRQHHLMNAAGCRSRARDPSVECDPDGDGVLCAPGPWDEKQARCRVFGLAEQATRSARLFEIAQEVFGEERVVRVLAGQFGAFSSRGEPMLRTTLPDGSALADHVDVYAIAPYFGGEVRSKKELEGAFTRTRKPIHGAPPGTYAPIAGSPSERYGGPHLRLASDVRALESYPGIRLAAYEGGPHFIGRTEALARAVAAVNRSPKMKRLYLSFLETWREKTGGALFLHYASSNAWGRHGAWGAKEYQGQPRREAPKYDALLTYMRGEDPPPKKKRKKKKGSR